MRQTLLIALAFLLAPLGTARGSLFQQAGPTERIPNMVKENLYPRWLSWVGVSPAYGPNSPFITNSPTSDLSVGVDSRNFTHVVQASATSLPELGSYSIWDGYYMQIFYKNDHVESRRGNGLSAYVVLDSTQHFLQTQLPSLAKEEYVTAPDLCVDPSDNIHAVWSHAYLQHRVFSQGSSSTPDRYRSIDPADHWELLYRRKTSTGWSPVVQLTLGTEPGVKYSNPRIAAGPNGVVHVLAERYDFNIPTIALNPSRSDVRPASSRIAHFIVTNGAVTGRGYLLGSWALGGGTPRLTVDGTNKVHAVWAPTYLDEPSGPLGDYSEAYYSTWNGGWSGAAALSSGTGPKLYSALAPDVCVDPANNVPHFAWTMTYKKNMGYPVEFSSIYYSTGGSVSPIPSNPLILLGNPAVVVDSRSQPHVMWQENGALHYAARVKNPGPGLSSTWRTQLPAIPAPVQVTAHVNIRKVAISKNDQIHVVTDRYYAKTLEYGLGVRDSAAMVGVFPGGALNTTSGNLTFALPLYQCSGVGPTQSLSLVYNSLEPYASSFTPGWKFNVEMHLVDHYLAENDPNATLNFNPSDIITLFLADGRPIDFRFKSYGISNPDFGYLVADDEFGYFGKLEKTAWGNVFREYKLTMKNKVVYTFNIYGRLRQIEDPAGNYLQIIYADMMDEDGNDIHPLVAISDTLGNATGMRPSMLMNYELRDNQLYSPRPYSMRDPSGSLFNFTYSGNQLASVRFSDGPGTPTHSFEYSTSNNPTTQERVNQLRRYLPPRGTAASTPYGWTCNYLPDGRFAQVDHPDEVYLLVGDADGTPPTSHIASTRVTYTESDPVDQPRKVMIFDPRGAQTKYVVEPRRSLAKEIHGWDVLLSFPNVFPTVRTFDIYGNLRTVTDRWGNTSEFVYHENAFPLHVKDNLESIWRPFSTGGGKQLVATFTYTFDGFNNVETASEYVLPVGGGADQTHTTTSEYNTYGQLTKIKLPDVIRPDNLQQTGVTRTFEYNGPKRQMTRMVDEEGHFTDFLDFSPIHGLPQNILREGGTQPENFAYDVMGDLFVQTRPTGGVMNDLAGSTIYDRDKMHRVTRVTDPAGKMTQLDYDLDSNLITVTPPVGDPSTTTYDRRGYVSGGASADGTWAQWVNASGTVARSRDVRGYETNCRIDVLNRVDEIRAPGGSSLAPGVGGGGPAIHTTQFTYDAFDGLRRWTLTTEVGSTGNRVTRTYFDSRGRTIRVEDPDGATATDVSFNNLDQPVAQSTWYSNVLQSCSIFYRDARNRVDHVRTQATPYGTTPPPLYFSDTYSLFNKTGAVVQTVDPLGDVLNASSYAHKTTYQRDARDRVSAVIDGLGVVVQEYRYGDDDLLAQVLVPNPATKLPDRTPVAFYGYTARKESRVVLNSRLEGVGYFYGDLPGQVTRVVDALGRTTHTLYESHTQRPSQVIEAEGTSAAGSTFYTWANGLLTQTKVFNPETGTDTATFTNTYDAAGRIEKMDYPTGLMGTAMASERRYFNDFGEAKQKITGGRTVDYAHNPLGQMTQRAFTGTVSGLETRAYNGAGLPASVTGGTQAKSMSWNVWNSTPVDETFSVNGSAWKTQTRQTDLAGNQTGMIDGEGQTHGWPVDANNRPMEKRLGTQAVTSIAYTPGGLVDYEILKDAAGSPIAKITHSYDDVGRKIRSVTISSATGEVLADFQYVYNAANEVVQYSHNHHSTTFTTSNDARGRLVNFVTLGNAAGTGIPDFSPSMGGLPTGNESSDSNEAKGTPRVTLAMVPWTGTYVYNPTGSRTSQTLNGVTTTYTYNARNQLMTETSPSGTVTHQYDEHGNETQRVTTPAGGGTATTEAFGYNHLNLMSTYTNSATGAAWQYDYWPDGERYSKTNLVTSASEQYVPRDGDVVTEYIKASGASPLLSNTYVQGLGVDSKSMRQQAGSSSRRYFLGDLVGTVAGALDEAGSVTEMTIRDAWGQVLAGATGERFGFAQRERDGESGLVFMRNRMYDPRTGRFTQTDPLLGNRPHKHYAYASNSPLDRGDPFGLDDDNYPVYNKAGTLLGMSLDINQQRAKEGKPPLTKAECNPHLSASQRLTLANPGDGSFHGKLVVISKGPSATESRWEGRAGVETSNMGDGIRVISKKNTAYLVTEAVIEYGSIELLTAGLGSGFLVAPAAARMTRATAEFAKRTERAAAGGVDLMKTGDKFLVNAAKRADVDPGGVLDIVAHGDSKSVEMFRGGKNIDVDHRMLADMIKHNPNYQGQPVRLLSCHTGEGADSFAQNLANKLKVDVTAPNKYLWANADGTTFVAGGKMKGKDLIPDMADLGTWETFSPKKVK